MADRSCTIYFANETPFRLIRKNFNAEHGHWDTDPPEVIEDKKVGSKDTPVTVWKITGNYGFYGATGMVDYLIQDQIKDVLFEVKDASGRPTLRGGANGGIRIEFESPFKGKPFCNTNFHALEDLLSSQDPSLLYQARARLLGQGDADFLKEFGQSVVLTPFTTIGSWIGSRIQHPIYLVRIRVAVPVTGQAVVSEGLSIETPILSQAKYYPVLNGPVNAWEGKWQHFNGKQMDVTVNIQMNTINTGIGPVYNVSLKDEYRAFLRDAAGLTIVKDGIDRYKDDFRTSVGNFFKKPFPGVFSQSIKLSGVVSKSLVKENVVMESPVHEKDVRSPDPVMLQLVDTLIISGTEKLHLYRYVYQNTNAAGSYAIQYVEKDAKGNIISNLMLSRKEVIR